MDRNFGLYRRTAKALNSISPLKDDKEQNGKIIHIKFPILSNIKNYKGGIKFV